MEFEEIYSKLRSMGLPVGYLQFSSPQSLPFIIWFESGGEVTGADNLNLYRRKNITVELYTDEKDVKLERKIEGLFREYELEKTVDKFLNDEKMFMTAYQFEIIQSIEEE